MSEIYPGGDAQYSNNLGLALWGADEVVVENFLLIDAAIGSGSSVQINGTVIPHVNFVNSATVTFSVVGSNVSATAVASGGVSSFIGRTGAVVAVGTDYAAFYAPISGGSSAWANLTGDLTETQVIPWDGPTVGTADTSLSRISAGLIGVGTGAQGSHAGSLSMANITVSGTTSFAAGSIAVAALSADTIGLTDSTGLFTVTGSPATLGGSLTLSAFASQSQNYVLAGPATGGAGAAAFRALVAADIPSAANLPLWSNLQNAAAALTLANANYATTFNQTSAVAWTWANTTVGTVGSTNASPLLELAANYWATGGVTGVDLWTIGTAAIVAGLNGRSNLTFTHTGTTGQAAVQVPLLDIGGTDTGISRSSSGVVLIGNGTQGDSTGTLICTNLQGNSGTLYFQTGGHDSVGFLGAGALALKSSWPLSWGTGDANGTQDTGISRLGAASLAIGNGTAGDVSGNLSLATLTLGVNTIFTNSPWLVFNASGNSPFGIYGSNPYVLSGRTGAVYGWSSTSAYNGATDSGISRVSAAVVAIGNGTAGDKTGALSLSRLDSYNADMQGTVSSAPSGIVAATVVVAVGAATATFTVTSTEGFTVGDTVTLSATGWTGGSGLASTTATVASVASTTSTVLTYVSGGPWVAGTYTTQTGTLAQTGGTAVSVIFATAYTNTPTVVVTPTSNAGAFYLSAVSTTGFTITYATSGTKTFNYMVMGNPN